MKKIILIGLLSTLILIGCDNEEYYGAFNESIEIEASIDNSNSRVAFDQNGKFFWTTGDAIGVTTTENKSSFTKMSIKEDGVGKSSASFSGKWMAGTPEGYAVYPHNANHAMSGTTLTYNFPDTYNYTVQDHDYFVQDGTGNSFNPPMWSTITNGKTSFKHLGGVLCIKIADLPAGQNQQLKLIASNKITGDFSVDISKAFPLLTTSASTENNVVTINYSNDEESTRVFYVPVPTGTYSKLTVEFEADGETQSLDFENKEVKVRQLKRLIIGEGSIEGDEEVGAEEVISVTEIEGILKESTTQEDLAVKVTGKVTDTENAITIPETLQAATTTFTFADIAENAKITITAENDIYDGQIIVEVPEGTDNSQIEAYVPNGEVYIKQGNVTNLLVSSKNETTIIGAGVEVGTLTVKKGNVRIEDGGSVGTICRSENTDAVTYVIYEAATAPEITLGENQPIVLVSAGEWDLRKAVENENVSSYQLQESIVLAEPLTIPSGKTFTLDLNGNTLSYSATIQNEAMITNNGNLTIKDSSTGENGKISFIYEGEADSTNSKGNYAITSYSGTTVVENGTIEVQAKGKEGKFPHALYAINIGAGNAKLTVNNGTIYNANNIAIRQFGTSEITVNGGEVKGLRAIWMQAPGSNANDAPEIKLTVNGGTLTSTAQDSEDSGNKLAVYSYSFGNDMQKVQINITGGTFNGDVALTGGKNKTNIETLTITGGTFNGLYGDVYSYGDVKKAAEKITITGGEFSSIEPMIYMNGANETVKLNGNVELQDVSYTFYGQGTLDLNNNTVSSKSKEAGKNYNLMDVQGTLTVKNGTITTEHVESNMGWNCSTNIFNVTAGGVLNLEDVVAENNGGSDMAFVAHLNNWGEVTLNATNTTFKSTYVGIRVFNSGPDKNNVTFDNCKIETGNSCIWVHNYVGADFGNKLYSGSKEAYDETKVKERLNFSFNETAISRTNGSKSLVRFGYNNAIYYSDIKMTEVVAGTEAALAWALENGKNVILNNDIELTSSIAIPAGSTITFDLNGKTISQTSETPVSMITNNGNLTIKDSGNSGKIAFTFNGTVDGGKAANAIENRGTLVVESGEISNTGTGNQIGYAIDNYNGSTLTVDGGKISASGSSYYDGIRLFCGSNETTVTVNGGEISTIWAQNPSADKATEVKGTVIINGGTINTTYYENYTTVKVKSDITTTVTAYGAGKDNTTTTTEDGYTVYSFVQSETNE